MSTTVLGIIVAAAVITVFALVAAVFISEGRRERRIMGFSANDFYELGTINRNRKAIKDLNKLYGRAKYMAFDAVSNGSSKVFVPISPKLPREYGEHFDKLLLNPFIQKLTKEGFSVTYLPNGSIQMEKHDWNKPAFEISWKPAADREPADTDEVNDASI